MSCIVIYYQDGAKHTRPVHSPQEYLALRDSEKQRELVARARAGDQDAKRRLLQFNYSCIPGEDGLLRGCKVASKSVGMDVDIHREENEDDDAYHARIECLPEQILSRKDELGLLMGEFSAMKGVHIAFRRHEDMTQEENLRWASQLLGVQYDEGAKDITRVFFTTTGSQEDLWFLSEELFDNAPSTSKSEPQTGCKMGSDLGCQVKPIFLS